MKLSIVTTLFKSESYLVEFYRRASEAAHQLVGDDYEIVFVNDGSPDESLEVAIELTKSVNGSCLTVIDLSRNFGHHKAMMAGLEHSTGELVFLIDCDLEEDPAWLLDFASTMSIESADVVYGVQGTRKGNWFERCSGSLYYTMLNYLIDLEIPQNMVTARIMSRRYVDSLLRFKERELVIGCLWIFTGYKQCARKVNKKSKRSSSYTFIKKLDLLILSITSFSDIPLKIGFYFGLIVSIVSLIVGTFLVYNRISTGAAVDGWASVMVSVWLLGGFLTFFIGLVGLYISKIFTETKQRPITITREIYGRSKRKD
jgi:putative glycosyltransferase